MVELNDFIFSIYPPLILASSITAISFWRWYTLLLGVKDVMLHLVLGIAIGFTILTLENLSLGISRIFFDGTLPTLLFILFKTSYIGAAILHCHSVYKSMTNSNKSTYRVMGFTITAWLIALGLLLIT